MDYKIAFSPVLSHLTNTFWELVRVILLFDHLKFWNTISIGIPNRRIYQGRKTYKKTKNLIDSLPQKPLYWFYFSFIMFVNMIMDRKSISSNFQILIITPINKKTFLMNTTINSTNKIINTFWVKTKMRWAQSAPNLRVAKIG